MEHKAYFLDREQQLSFPSAQFTPELHLSRTMESSFSASPQTTSFSDLSGGLHVTFLNISFDILFDGSPHFHVSNSQHLCLQAFSPSSLSGLDRSLSRAFSNGHLPGHQVPGPSPSFMPSVDVSPTFLFVVIFSDIHGGSLAGAQWLAAASSSQYVCINRAAV